MKSKHTNKLLGVSKKHKCIFIHIPKCGGRTIWKLLDIPGSHDTVREKINCMGEDYNNYFTFTVLRHPWDRMVSLYHWKKRQEWKIAKGSFRGFLVEYKETVEEMYGNKKRAYNVYHNFLKNHKGEFAIDYIARLEILSEDINSRFGSRVGINNIRRLPVMGKTKRTVYTKYYDTETIDIVYEMFEKDIEYFGYKYNDPLSVNKERFGFQNDK